MAGSRLEKLGTVFTRTRDMLRSGVLAEAQKPLWFDVYAAFPPLREPVYREPGQRYGKVKDVIPPILYQEDEIRAFVEKFNELQKEGKIEPEKLFEETGKQLLAEGIFLRRKRTANVAQQTRQEAKTRDLVVGMNLQTMLEERQEQKQDQEEHLESTDVKKENPLS
ncbi:28S ribosomal protein S23, mitochondrial isoform X2 [Terrapene carolina triunguis]|uniref:28S ribosomal protein S23, mitochondrial isoform X2 n=1 Tax=Terrapene triunguis TaxID=2587831 RepID=UPI000E776071|nr:28S ribosomal protein S23, mitochondrial isoform X2 [Terrapene carolina triunguis]